MERETRPWQKEVEISLAGDLPDQFAHLRHELDRKKVPPTSEVCRYSFSQTAILYAYPHAVRSLLELYQSDVDRVTVTTHEGPGAIPMISIRIFTDAAGVLEITPPANQESEAAYILSQVDQGNSANVPLTANEVSELLISLAVSPTDLSDIHQARRVNATVTSPDPRDPSVFYLMKNSLDNYASDYSSVERYRLRHDTPYEDTPIDIDLFVTKNSDGSDCYDVAIDSSYVEDGYAAAVTMSARCFSDVDSLKNKITVQGQRRTLTTDGESHEMIDKTAVTAYLSSLLETLANSTMTPAKATPARL